MGKRAVGNILVTGALGQIGSELTTELRRRYGDTSVVASDLRPRPDGELGQGGPFEQASVTDAEALAEICRRHDIDTIVHLAAILSATGEKDPMRAWHVNMSGLINALEIARDLELTRVLCPSSIAVFGAGCPRENTPQETVLRPSTMYGVTKVAGELLCDYYVARFGVDARGLRYPGIVSAETLPGGGTTDYAVEIYYEAIANGRYTCFLSEDTRLPMMYMPDCIKATIDLMDADPTMLKHHADFNLSSMSFSAEELTAEIQVHIPEFSVVYEPDPVKQAIADSWPRTIDDRAARKEWGWQPTYDLQKMTVDMIDKLGKRYQEGDL